MKKRLVSILTLIAMITSSFGMFSIARASDEVISKVVYDLADKNYDYCTTTTATTFRSPQINNADGSTEKVLAVQFKNKGAVSVDDIGDEKAILYYGSTSSENDPYIYLYANNEETTITTGRLVYTGKFYSSTSKVSGTFDIGRNTDYRSRVNLWSNNTMKAKTWYDFKIVLDMDKDTNNLSYTFSEKEIPSSGQRHVVSYVGTYTGLSFSKIRADIDVPAGSTTEYTAYADLKLTYNTHSSSIKSYSNGNLTDNTYDNGVFVAETAGSGIFAIGLYKEDELVSLSVAENEEELEYVKLSMAIENGEDTYMKIFRFDSDGTPICVNKTLTPQSKDYRVFFNETFDNGSAKLNTASVTSDGQIKISGNNVRYGGLSVYFPDRHFVVEADYTLEEGAQCSSSYLLCSYTNSPVALVYMGADGLYAKKNGTKFLDDEYFEEKRKINIACVFDLEEFTYDIYVDDELKIENVTLSGLVYPESKYSGITFYALYFKDATNTMYLDNYKAYSGSQLIDIGNDIPTAYKTDFKNSPIWETDIYERPEAGTLAARALEAGHPRVMINADRVNEIKISQDENIKKWKEEIIAKADALLSTDIYAYNDFNPDDGSLDNIDTCLADMMNLGLAYQLADNEAEKKAYSDRAYAQAEVFMDFTAYHEDKKAWVSKDWNSDSYLDVGEISAIMSVCYDWMYDAWSDEQKKAITDAVMECSIDISYKAFFGETLNKEGNNTGISWMKSTNNWNAVCNGGVLTAALAFMEADVHRCSQLAEGTIRGFEYLLPKFAPDGAWYEGTGYWAYTMKYLTIACSTLEASCGTLFGLENTPGFKRSQTYSLDLEGATGSFAFGDGSGNHVKAPYMYYWAKVYDDKEIGGAAKYAMDKFSFNANAFDLIYYNPDYVSDTYHRPLSTYRAGTEVVTIASGHEKEDTVIAITGGLGTGTSHDHIDSGSVVVDINGMRLIGDTGAEHYDATGYFADGRYYYYKARPEGHNVFVINPQELYDQDGNFYHGQAKDAYSTATLDKETGVATMDLTAAYTRDASNAERKIYLTENSGAVIEDEITLKSEGSLVEWYYHFKDIISYVYNDSTYYKANTFANADGKPYCDVVIDTENNCVYITYQAFTVNSKYDVTLDGTFKKYKITFESDCEFTIERRDAERNPYDADVLEDLRNYVEDGKAAPKFLHDYYTYSDLSNHKYSDNGGTYPMDKIVVVMEDAKDTINLKATIEAVNE